MVAHLHGQTLNVSRLVESHDFTRQQISSYLDLFEQTFVIRRLPPYFTNAGKRLTKRPKIFMRDSGLQHQLLHIKTSDTLHGHPMRGASWEGFVVEQIIALLPEWSPHFYRTSNGAELDLLMLRSDKILAFEIKAAMAPKLTKGSYTAREDVNPTQTYIVSRTNDTWKTADGSIHTNLRMLPQQLVEWD
jgi:predicted AAA+ superfamily ATPase